MNNLFNKTINGCQFNFQPFNAGNTVGYHVDVKDEEGARHEFRMEHQGDTRWVLNGENLPDWITRSESEIIDAIYEHE